MVGGKKNVPAANAVFMQAARREDRKLESPIWEKMTVE